MNSVSLVVCPPLQESRAVIVSAGLDRLLCRSVTCAQATKIGNGKVAFSVVPHSGGESQQL